MEIDKAKRCVHLLLVTLLIVTLIATYSIPDLITFAGETEAGVTQQSGDSSDVKKELKVPTFQQREPSGARSISEVKIDSVFSLTVQVQGGHGKIWEVRVTPPSEKMKTHDVKAESITIQKLPKNAEVKLVPFPDMGYETGTVCLVVDGKTKDLNEKRSFLMPEKNATVIITFTARKYPVTYYSQIPGHDGGEQIKKSFAYGETFQILTAEEAGFSYPGHYLRYWIRERWGEGPRGSSGFPAPGKPVLGFSPSKRPPGSPIGVIQTPDPADIYYAGTSYTMDSSYPWVNFRAVWGEAFCLRYVGNGEGAKVPVEQSVPSGGAVKISGQATRTDYVFRGWNTVADGSGQYYVGGDQIINMRQDLTLYAQWEEASVSQSTDDDTLPAVKKEDAVNPKEPAPPEDAVNPGETAAPEDAVNPKEPASPEDAVNPKEPAPPEDAVNPGETAAPEDAVNPKEPAPPEDAVNSRETVLPQETVQSMKPEGIISIERRGSLRRVSKDGEIYVFIDENGNPLGGADAEMAENRWNEWDTRGLPKTGGLGELTFLGLGVLIVALGAGLRRREGNEKEHSTK